jgi:hypothetical protein
MLTGDAQIPAVSAQLGALRRSLRLSAIVRGFAGLFFVSLGGHRLEIFGFEDLAAIETFHVIHPIAACDDDGSLMVAGGRHKSTLRDTNYFSEPEGSVKRS